MEEGSSVRCALTIDVEPNIIEIMTKTGEKYSGLTKAMPKLLDILTEHEISATWFITHDYWGKINREFPSLVERMSNNGEIGCHVHFRGEKEVYYTGYDFQMELIERATNSLRDQGFDVNSFRGGNHFFNENTLRVLEELNYEVDSSVLPGLYSKPYPDLIVNHKERLSTKPYFPSYTNHCIPGSSKILEIPLAVYPYFQFNTRLVSVLIARQLSMPLTGEHLLRINRMIKKGIKEDFIPIVLSAHPWNFLDSMERQLQYLEEFIVDMKSLDVKFVTLKEIRREWLKRNKEVLGKKPRLIITASDILKLAKPILKLRTKHV